MKDVWLRGGPPAHPWVYDKRVRRVDAGTSAGAVVRVKTREGRPVGYAFFHPHRVRSVRPGTLYCGFSVRPALELRTAGEQSAPLYLGFEDAGARQRLLDDLRLDVDQEAFVD